MTDADGNMHVTFVGRHQVRDAQVVVDIQGGGQGVVRVRKDGKTVVGPISRRFHRV